LLLVTAIVLVFLAPLGSRIGWWNYYFAVTLFKWAAIVSGIAFLLIIAGLFFSKKGNRKQAIRLSLVVVFLSIPVIGTLLYWQDAKQKYPAIQDISTDLFEPPEFWYAP